MEVFVDPIINMNSLSLSTINDHAVSAAASPASLVVRTQTAADAASSTRASPLLDLPTEVIVKILNNLNIKDLVAVSRTSVGLKEIFDNNISQFHSARLFLAQKYMNFEMNVLAQSHQAIKAQFVASILHVPADSLTPDLSAKFDEIVKDYHIELSGLVSQSTAEELAKSTTVEELLLMNSFARSPAGKMAAQVKLKILLTTQIMRETRMHEIVSRHLSL